MTDSNHKKATTPVEPQSTEAYTLITFKNGYPVCYACKSKDFYSWNYTGKVFDGHLVCAACHPKPRNISKPLRAKSKPDKGAIQPMLLL